MYDMVFCRKQGYQGFWYCNVADQLFFTITPFVAIQ